MRCTRSSALLSKIADGRISASALFISVALVSASFSADKAANALPDAMDAYMQARVKANDFSGTVLVARKGNILLSRGYGEANREWQVPSSPTTRFRIGSITKQFTATLIMQLQERHRLQVADPVCQYLDPCPEAWKSITIRHLLSHTAGIPNYTDEPDFDQKEPLQLERRSADRYVSRQAARVLAWDRLEVQQFRVCAARRYHPESDGQIL